MKFALVNGQRQEAQPSLSGECSVCGKPVIARCGEVRIRHWAHKGGRHCDQWWETETEWHRNWKNQFPVYWQEIGHRAETGEQHVADVKTDRGWVIEFQYSYLKPDERRSRENFYPKLIWVVNGARRQRDRPQLISAWNGGAPGPNSRVRRIFSDDCVLLREWGGSNTVFFDFEDLDVLWWLFGKSTNGWAYVVQFPRAVFIASHCAGATEEASQGFDNFVITFPKQLAEYESLITNRPIQGVQRFPAPRIGRRRRF